MAKGEYYYGMPAYAGSNKVTVAAKEGYYIAYVAFCCQGNYDLFSSNPYDCTAPQTLYADNGSKEKSVSFTLTKLRDMQKQGHKEYCWLMVMLAPITDSPVEPDPTGTLTIQKQVVGNVNSSGFKINVKGTNYDRTQEVMNGEKVLFENLLFGTYTITEIDAAIDGYDLTTTYDNQKVNSYVVTLGENNPEVTVAVTNTYTPNTGDDENHYATISVKKHETGNANKLLAGAKFKLEKLDGTNWVAYGSVGTTDANGALAYTVMDAGDYKLTEVEAPAGYKLSGKSEWTFTVAKSSSTKTVDNKIVNVYDYKITKVGEEMIAPENQVTTHLFEIANTKIPTVAVAIQKVVKVTGNTAPGSVVFTFGAKYQDANKNWVELPCANNTITTNGAGTYTRNDMTITLPDTIPAGGLEIVIYEKNDGRANWTYSKDTYKLHVLAAGTIEAVPATNSTSATLPSVPVYSFENTYSYTYTPPARPSDPIRRQPTTTTTKPVQSVKTGDMGIALYAVTSLLSLSGTALLIKKRKDEK